MSKAFSTIITTFLLKKLQFDTSLYGALHDMINESMNFIESNGTSIINTLYISDMSFIFLILLGCIVFAYILKNNLINIGKLINKQYQLISIADNQIMYKFNWYFVKYDKYITTKHDYNMGTAKQVFMQKLADERLNISKCVINEIKPFFDQKIYFNDTKFGVYGYFIWHIESTTKKTSVTNISDKTKESEESYHIDTFDLYLKKSNKCSPKDYYNSIIKEYNEYVELNRGKQLEFVRTFYKYSLKDNDRDRWATNIFGNEKLDTYTDNYMFDQVDDVTTIDYNIMNTFYHQDKEYLLELIESMKPENIKYFQDFGQIPKLGILLYGEPGNGKSSLVYRISVFLRRTIIKLNPLESKRKELYKLLSQPCINHITYDPKHVIYSMDEFDEIFLELLRREKLKIEYNSTLLQNRSCTMESDFVINSFDPIKIDQK